MHLLLSFLILVFSNLAQAANILVIESYHQELPWVQDNSRGLKSVLGNQNQLEYLYLDSKRIPAENHPAQAQKAWQHFIEVKPDLVIICDDDAINLLAHRIARHGTPVVYLGMNSNPRQNGTYGSTNITGVLERPLLKRNIVEMSALLGSPQKALVLFDDSAVSKTALRDNFGNVTSWKLNTLRVDLLQTDSYPHWQGLIRTARAEGYEMIFIGLYHTLRDQNGKHIDTDEAIRWASKESNVPLFGFWDFSVGPQKAIGGLVMSGYEQGAAAGAMANELLQGKTAKALTPRIASRGEYLFSHSGMSRWKLSPPYEQTNILWVE